HRVGINVLSSAGGRGAHGASRPTEATPGPLGDGTYRERPEPSVVVGHHVSALAGAWRLLLPLPDGGCVEPQGRRLACRRQRVHRDGFGARAGRYHFRTCGPYGA